MNSQAISKVNDAIQAFVADRAVSVEPGLLKLLSDLDFVVRVEEKEAAASVAQEMRAVIEHFQERPVITAEDCTEEDARWIMRYDRVRAELRKVGLV